MEFSRIQDVRQNLSAKIMDTKISYITRSGRDRIKK